jgi:hypothetical protein
VNLRKSIVWVALCTGCISPADTFDEFVARKEAEAASGLKNTTPTGNGTPLLPEQIAGTYLYTVSTQLAKTNPVVYVLEVEAEGVPGGSELTLKLREKPLACADRKTPVGEFGDWLVSTVNATGLYTSPTVEKVVPAAANTAQGCNTESMIKVTFSGTISNPGTAADPAAKVAFWCGDMTGSALGGLIPLMGKFTATRITDPNNYPPVVIDCEKTPADPIP